MSLKKLFTTSKLWNSLACKTLAEPLWHARYNFSWRDDSFVVNFSLSLFWRWIELWNCISFLLSNLSFLQVKIILLRTLIYFFCSDRGQSNLLKITPYSGATMESSISLSVSASSSTFLIHKKEELLPFWQGILPQMVKIPTKRCRNMFLFLWRVEYKIFANHCSEMMETLS